MTPTGQEVADFLGQGDDEHLVALAGEHVQIVTAMAHAYCRGGGFTEGHPDRPELVAVITTATARMVANPEQIRHSIGSVRLDGGFTGWSLAETFVLNRYRRRSM